MISLYEPQLSYCDPDLEDSNPVFTHDTLAYNGVSVSPYWVWLHMGYSDFDLEDCNPVWLQKVQQFIKTPSKLTLIEMFNLGCDIDLEHSNPIFSLTLLSYDDLPSNWIWLEKPHWFRTNKRYSRYIVETVIFWLNKPTLWPWPWR